MATLAQPFGPVEVRSAVGLRRTTFLTLGATLAALGAISLANVPGASAVSAYVVGICMVLAAVGQIGAMLLVGKAQPFILLTVGALFHGVGGGLVLQDPALAAKALNVAIAVMLVSSGVMRVSWSIEAHLVHAWEWITASGVVTLLVGFIFIVGWPAEAIWVPGTLLALDLLLQGAMAIAFGLGLRAPSRPATP